MHTKLCTAIPFLTPPGDYIWCHLKADVRHMPSVRGSGDAGRSEDVFQEVICLLLLLTHGIPEPLFALRCFLSGDP